MKRRVRRHTVKQPLDQSYRLIPLTQCKNVLVDTLDYEWLAQWNWMAWKSKQGRTFYAITHPTFRENPILMHRLIMEAKPGEEIDHRNKNGLDNRRANLRRTTHSNNCANSVPRRTNKSGYKGAYFDGRRGFWQSTIRCKGKTYGLGRFRTAEEAARAYDKKAKELFGEFAHLNFP